MAVLGLLLGVATFAFNRIDKDADARAAAREKAASAAAEQQRQARLSAVLFRAEPADEGRRLLLAPADAAQLVQRTRYLFPTAVRGQAREVAGAEAQIDAAWLDGLGKASRDGREQEAELPVGVVSTVVQQGETRTDGALYDLSYTIEEKLLGRDRTVLRGWSLWQRVPPERLQAAVEARWRALHPEPPAP